MTSAEQATRALLDRWLSDSALLEIVFLGVQDGTDAQTSLRLMGYIKELSEEHVTIGASREPFLTVTLELGGGIDFAASENRAPDGENDSRRYKAFVTFELPAGGSLFLGELLS